MMEKSLENPNITIVRRFADAWMSRDMDAVCDFVTEDFIWYNPNSAPIIGPKMLRDALSPNLSKTTGIEMSIHEVAIASDGETVFTERLDVMIFGHDRVEAPVVGVFKVKNAKIYFWRDYFDHTAYRQQMARIGQVPGIDVE